MSHASGSRAPLRVAALLSGTGSNFAVLQAASARGDLPLEFVRVISNKPRAPGLAHAREAGIPASLIDRATAPAGDQDRAIEQALREATPDLVLLTGYMRILGPAPVNAFRGQMINQHPSLLPRYKGLHTYRRALEAGDREHGASIHFVTPELDDGPVISQVRIPIHPDDTEATLMERLRPREHALLLATMELFVERRLGMKDGRVALDGETRDQPLQLNDANDLS